MTPRIIDAYKKAFKLKKEEQNAFAYIQGIYFRDALASTVGNMFKKKGAKAIEYPSKPYDLNAGAEEESGEQDGGMSEAEKRKKTEALFGMLRLMQANFEIAKQAENTRGEE